MLPMDKKRSFRSGSTARKLRKQRILIGQKHSAVRFFERKNSNHSEDEQIKHDERKKNDEKANNKWLHEELKENKIEETNKNYTIRANEAKENENHEYFDSVTMPKENCLLDVAQDMKIVQDLKN